MAIPGMYRTGLVGFRCSRCQAPLAFDGEPGERLFCAPCLHIVDADPATKRSILLPQMDQDGDSLSALF
jgi:hypothetical protein